MADDDELRRNWDLNRESAVRAHNIDYEFQKGFWTSAFALAEIAIRTATLISGGCAIVGLAFVGGIFPSNETLARALMGSIFVFALGAIFGGTAASFGYVTHYYYARSQGEKKHDWNYPYVHKTVGMEAFERKARNWHIAAVAMVVCSYLFIIFGILLAWSKMS